MAQGLRDVLGAWDDLRRQVDEYRELDEIRTLVLSDSGDAAWRAGLSLANYRNRERNMFHVREGVVTRIDFYFDCGRALADLGFEG